MLMAEAMELSSSYDLIIVVDWLRDEPTYARKIEDLVFNGVRGLSVGTINNHNFVTSSQNLQNEKQPLQISNSTLQRCINQRNDIDINLFRTVHWHRVLSSNIANNKVRFAGKSGINIQLTQLHIFNRPKCFHYQNGSIRFVINLHTYCILIFKFISLSSSSSALCCCTCTVVSTKNS